MPRETLTHTHCCHSSVPHLHRGPLLPEPSNMLLSLPGLQFAGSEPKHLFCSQKSKTPLKSLISSRANS